MPKRAPKLLFTDEERQAPTLKRAIKKADKASANLDEAEANIPKKQAIKKQRYVDKDGRVKTKISFEEVDKKRPSSNLKSEIRTAPAHIAAGAAVNVLRENEDDSTAASAAHGIEKTAGASIKTAQFRHHSSKQKPYRKADKAEKELDKANITALEKRAKYQPKETKGSNPQSKFQQKRAIKKEYAAAKRNGASTKKASEITKNAAERGGEAAKKAAEFAANNKGFLLVLAIIAAVIVLISCISSSCSVMFEGATSVIASTTYPSTDSAMLAVEEMYIGLEQSLANIILSFESAHDYDEYVYELDDIEHDPYVLISMLSAMFQGEWSLSDVESAVTDLFSRQYVLTENVEREERTRTVSNGDGTTREETYSYYICTITLVNNNLSHIPSEVLSEEQLQMYATYMKTLGNRPDLFPDLFPDSVYVTKYYNTEYTAYDIPAEAMSGERFAAMIAEAEKYLGYPYVWGGSSPATSFDCSGFVCWVLNHAGYTIGRTSAEGLRRMCTAVSPENAQPGDLIFFENTYNTSGASHVGIYVGNGMMIHCGDPIQYASVNSSYFTSHFMQYGRLSN